MRRIGDEYQYSNVSYCHHMPHKELCLPGLYCVLKKEIERLIH